MHATHLHSRRRTSRLARFTLVLHTAPRVEPPFWGILIVARPGHGSRMSRLDRVRFKRQSSYIDFLLTESTDLQYERHGVPYSEPVNGKSNPLSLGFGNRTWPSRPTRPKKNRTSERRIPRDRPRPTGRHPSVAGPRRPDLPLPLPLPQLGPATTPYRR